MARMIQLNPKEIQLGFVASCIEFVADELKESYFDVYRRMKRADMLNSYIYEFYDVLHTESRENLTAELVDLLQRREGNETDGISRIC